MIAPKLPLNAAPMAPRVLAVLSRVTEDEGLHDELEISLYETGILDSLKTVELIVALSEEFGIDISPAEFERDKWATPGKIISDISNRVRQ
jgi:D-alanine--poly(phosphoribitol) ligase subunit 2